MYVYIYTHTVVSASQASKAVCHQRHAARAPHYPEHACHMDDDSPQPRLGHQLWNGFLCEGGKNVVQERDGESGRDTTGGLLLDRGGVGWWNGVRMTG